MRGGTLDSGRYGANSNILGGKGVAWEADVMTRCPLSEGCNNESRFYIGRQNQHGSYPKLLCVPHEWLGLSERLFLEITYTNSFFFKLYFVQLIELQLCLFAGDKTD
jgi:hypothetical protein